MRMRCLVKWGFGGMRVLWNEAGTGRLNVPVGMRVVVEVVWSGRQLGGRAMEWAQVSSWNERADCALLRYTAVEL